MIHNFATDQYICSVCGRTSENLYDLCFPVPSHLLTFTQKIKAYFCKVLGGTIKENFKFREPAPHSSAVVAVFPA